MKTFSDILKEVATSCDRNFSANCRDIRSDIVEASTKIYIAELYVENLKNVNLEQRKKVLTEETHKLMWKCGGKV